MNTTTILITMTGVLIFVGGAAGFYSCYRRANSPRKRLWLIIDTLLLLIFCGVGAAIQFGSPDFREPANLAYSFALPLVIIGIMLHLRRLGVDAPSTE